MTKGILTATIMAAILLGARSAAADDILCEFFGICFNGGGGHQGAPAPLLAAGIPAFAALSGGVVVSRLVRRFRKRA